MSYSLLADLILIGHTLFAAFVVLALPLILIGGKMQWPWVRNPWFRTLHLAGIGIVVAESWAGVICPLTEIEMWLRREAGQASYRGSFIEHWLQKLLYFDAPAWVFVSGYSLFAILVLAAWLLVPPRRFRKAQ